MQQAGILHPINHPVIGVPNYMDHFSFTDPRDVPFRSVRSNERWMAELAMLAD